MACVACLPLGKQRAVIIRASCVLCGTHMTSQGLHLLGYRGGNTWWEGVWRQVAQVIPTGLYDTHEVGR
jgi:hypothetical protein